MSTSVSRKRNSQTLNKGGYKIDTRCSTEKPIELSREWQDLISGRIWMTLPVKLSMQPTEGSREKYTK